MAEQSGDSQDGWTGGVEKALISVCVYVCVSPYLPDYLSNICFVSAVKKEMLAELTVFLLPVVFMKQ